MYDVNIQPENYFFSFKPWRKFEDLRNKRDTYIELFQKIKLHSVRDYCDIMKDYKKHLKLQNN